MKGIELPISTLIIIIVVLLVLLGVVSLWMGSWSGGSTGMNVEAAKATACAEYIAKGCDRNPHTIPVNFDADNDGLVMPQTLCDDSCMNVIPGWSCDNLLTLGRCWFGCDGTANVENCVRKLCGCQMI